MCLMGNNKTESTKTRFQGHQDDIAVFFRHIEVEQNFKPTLKNSHSHTDLFTKNKVPILSVIPAHRGPYNSNPINEPFHMLLKGTRNIKSLKFLRLSQRTKYKN